MTDPNEEPKIIVDDDWKDQVQKEKAAAEESAKAVEQRRQEELKKEAEALAEAHAAAEAATDGDGVEHERRSHRLLCRRHH